ncbi:MAG: prepilin peptidase [Candidatus Omnitrophota bacterium]
MFEMTLALFVFLLGICVGSFLNVCIYRMGREQSVVKPRSHCPHCRKTIAWYDNIPLVSFIALGGRCRSCKKKISFRYFFIELLTGIVFLVIYQRFYISVYTLAYLVFVCGLIVATFVDFDFRIIPDEISVGGIIVGLVFSLLFPGLHHMPTHILGLWQSFLGVLVGGGVLWVLGCIGDFIFKKESMGGGDVKLLAMIGAFLGWKLALLTLPLASVFGAIIGIIIKIRTKESLIAFGPYLALAAFINIFWADKILYTFFLRP